MPKPSETWGKRVPRDVRDEWERRLAKEGLGEDAERAADSHAALEAMGLDPQTVRDLRSEILMYLVTREETFGGHERAVRRLASQFGMQDREIIIEAAIRDQEEAVAQIARSVRDLSARIKSDRAAMRALQEQYPNMPEEVLDIVYDRYGHFSERAQ